MNEALRPDYKGRQAQKQTCQGAITVIQMRHGGDSDQGRNNRGGENCFSSGRVLSRGSEMG